MPPAPPPSGWLQTRVMLRALVIVLLAAACLWLVFTLRRVLLLMVLTVFFAYLLAPLVDLLQRPQRKGGPWVSRPVAVALAYLLVFGSLAAGVASVLPGLGRQLGQIGAEAPARLSALSASAQSFLTTRARAWPSPVRETLDHAISNVGPLAAGWIGAALVQAAAYLRFLPWIGLMPVLAFFLLKDATTLRAWLLRALPQGRSRWRGSDLFDEVNRVLASYIRAQLLSCLFIALISLAGFALLGVPYALVLALVGGVLEFIPMLGTALSFVIACSVASSAGLLVSAAVFLIVLRLAQDYIVYPRLVGRGLKLHPLAIILALVCGSQLGGMAGLFLAIPLVAVGSVAYRYLKLQLGTDNLVAALFAAEEHIHVAAITPSKVPLPVAEAVASVMSGVRVLIVDNDDDAREVVAMVLREEGVEVLTAASASEAVTLLQQELPDVLISDIGMPNEDGLDLIRRVRALPPGAGNAVPAAALTGYTTKEDRARILLAGYQLHLKKPVACEDLLKAIATLASQSAQTRAASAPQAT